MKRALLATATCFVAGCAATGFQPVEPQPAGFDKDSPCNVVPLVQRATPAYPDDALDEHQPGWVALQYDVGADGVPGNVAVVSASPPGVFEESAIAAVSQYRYRPAEEPVAHTGCRLLITFRPPDLDAPE